MTEILIAIALLCQNEDKFIGKSSLNCQKTMTHCVLVGTKKGDDMGEKLAECLMKKEK